MLTVRQVRTRSHRLPQIDILLGTEILGDGDAVKVFADLTVVDGSDIEEQDKSDKDED